MAEKELVLDVKELHVVSVTCVKCRYGTIYDLEQVKPMPEAARSVTYYLKFECNCGESAANDVDKMLTSLWSAYQSLCFFSMTATRRFRPSIRPTSGAAANSGNSQILPRHPERATKEH